MGKRRKVADDTGDVSGAPEGTVLQLGADGPPADRIKYHVETIIGLIKRVREANGRLSKAWEAAEAEGLNKAASKQSMKLLADDPKAAREFVKNLVTTCEVMGLQLELGAAVDGAQKIASREAMIFQEGFDLGAAGAALKSDKFRPDSDEWNIFANGWHAGQKSIFKIKAPEKKDDKPAGESVVAH